MQWRGSRSPRFGPLGVDPHISQSYTRRPNDLRGGLTSQGVAAIKPEYLWSLKSGGGTVRRHDPVPGCVGHGGELAPKWEIGAVEAGSVAIAGERRGRALLPAVVLGMVALAACSTPTPVAAPMMDPTQPRVSALLIDPTSTSTATSTETPTPTPTPAPPTATPTLAPDAWQDLPIVPTVSQRAREVYERGLAMGNDPSAFSVIGDCEGTPNRFLGPFDHSSAHYRLGDFAYLEDVIHHFAGSFGRISMAANSSFTTSMVLSQFWANPNYCLASETPLTCEIRVHRPSIAFVMVGTMDYLQADTYEEHMRRILDTLIEDGVVPILYTKASNLEGDWSINATTARLAYEYDVPLWNFWRAVQPLPGHGLRPDGMHVTWGYNFFDDPVAMSNGWPWRNLTALQALEAVWGAVAGPQPDA